MWSILGMSIPGKYKRQLLSLLGKAREARREGKHEALETIIISFINKVEKDRQTGTIEPQTATTIIKLAKQLILPSELR